MKLPVKERKHAALYLFAGIHDGYKGSVPITHSLNFYNMIISAWGAKKSERISDKTMLDLVTMRGVAEPTGFSIGERAVLFRRVFKNVNLTIFEGGHEMLSKVALEIPGIGP
jgi:hypothetical protein